MGKRWLLRHRTRLSSSVLNRKNGDGSQGTYELAVAGNSYAKIGDKNGAHYVLDKGKLALGGFRSEVSR